MTIFFKNAFAVAGIVAPIPEDAQANGSVSYEQGFSSDYALESNQANYKAVPLDQSNQLYNDITSALQQYQTHGFPDFVTTVDNGGVPYPYDIGNTNLPTGAGWIIVSLGGQGVPTGAILDFGASLLPAGYLACDGTAVSRVTFVDLFSIIGTIWGIGDGVTTFNLPDCRRRVGMGSGGTGTATIGNSVGNIGGEEAHAQTLAEMAAHSHTSSSGTPFLVQQFPEPGFFGGNSFAETADPTTSIEGSSQAANIIQPSYIVTKMIKC
jgi:microcystin-dependent protein